jgi:hypothetical protein
MKRKNMTAAQTRAATPATEKWVQDALKMLGEPGLDSGNNEYAYTLRCFELRFPLIARLTIPLFARAPTAPWWKHNVTVYVRGR